MTLGTKIRNMLMECGVTEVMAGVYLGNSTTYAVYAYDTTPGEMADDAEVFPFYDVRINYVAPLATNTRTMVKTIREAIWAEFSEVALVADATDETAQDYRFEFTCVWNDIPDLSGPIFEIL